MDSHRIFHLVRRFFGSLRHGGPPAGERIWVQETLSPTEFKLWELLSDPDRRHSVDVASQVNREMSNAAPRTVLAAALLHDVGKVESRLGTFMRVLATLMGAFLGFDRVRGWAHHQGRRGRIGRYVDHPELGSQLLLEAQSDDLVVSWAREHHLSSEFWTLDPELARMLKSADDD